MSDSLPSTCDVVIIGGGVMGTSIAYHLARRAAGRIVLLEKEQFFGQGATGACAGGIRHQFSTEVNIRLSTISIQMLERFPEEMEQEIDLNFCGYLFLLSSEQDVVTFRRNVELQHRLGIETEWLDRDEIARRAPWLDLDAEPAIIAGTNYHRDGLADPHSVVQGFVKQARRLGVGLYTDTPVTAILCRGEKVVGVETPRGRISAPVVVLAAGPWSAPIAATAGIDLPVQPLRRQIVVTRPLGMPRDMPFLIDFAQSLYFHYESGGILTGMSNHNETPGEKLDVDHAWTMVHLEHAMARMPLLEQAELLTEWAGLYEVTPDHQPIIGPLPVEGLYACTGFSGHGFMQGPVCGLLIAEDILDGGAHTVDIGELRYDRFLEHRLAPEKNVV
ncbi:MAG: FAD-binding oxidoreductase [Caldilineae bacterium]|nr:MAG: FAD-binding oxidoreductase [Caldilineae bacterium]